MFYSVVFDFNVNLWSFDYMKIVKHWHVPRGDATIIRYSKQIMFRAMNRWFEFSWRGVTRWTATYRSHHRKVISLDQSSIAIVNLETVLASLWAATFIVHLGWALLVGVSHFCQGISVALNHRVVERIQLLGWWLICCQIDFYQFIIFICLIHNSLIYFWTCTRMVYEVLWLLIAQYTNISSTFPEIASAASNRWHGSLVASELTNFNLFLYRHLLLWLFASSISLPFIQFSYLFF